LLNFLLEYIKYTSWSWPCKSCKWWSGAYC